MHMILCKVRRLGRLVLVGSMAALFWLAHPHPAQADTNTAPVITRQPANGIGGIGEDFVFSVQATSPTPVSYQWYFNGNLLSGEVNPFLYLPNLTTDQSGLFLVTVANSSGVAVSSNAYFSVQLIASRRLETGRALQLGSQVGVPITLRANGRENSVSFSLAYDTNSFSNPIFLATDTNAAVTPNLTLPGTIGVAEALPAGSTFPAGSQWLGLVRFDLAPGSNVLQGGLNFVTNPAPVAAYNTNALSLGITAYVQPQFLLTSTNAQLNPQSGLFEQQLLIGNPGNLLMTNLDIFALNPGTDSMTNTITFYNAQSNSFLFPYADPLLEVACDCSCGLYSGGPANPACDFSSYLACGTANCSIDNSATNVVLAYAQIFNLQPGETRRLTLEFYVPDHVTVPTPKYSFWLGDVPLPRVPPVYATGWTLTASRYTNNTFLVEFPTVAGSRYYIQYASTPDDLATNPQTVLPIFTGAGAPIQWLDNGPPKTDSPPVNNARFYRVLQSE
jgi:hypothetical protein